MRNIILKIEDEDSFNEISAKISLDFAEDLYDKTGINGIMITLHKLNEEMNNNLNENVKFSFFEGKNKI